LAYRWDHAGSATIPERRTPQAEETF
jgi:hypothetical protein